ncbi:hypothetical protein PFISCL1PPCAC_20402, partial [Pristionchus fissidentatus]
MNGMSLPAWRLLRKAFPKISMVWTLLECARTIVGLVQIRTFSKSSAESTKKIDGYVDHRGCSVNPTNSP